MKPKIFIATGNKDKLNRISKWFDGIEADLASPFDLNPHLAELTKITDQEEKQAGSMQERAKAKAAKAARQLLGREGFTDVIALDDTAYLPWLKLELLDLRYPPEISFRGRVIAKQVSERLERSALANFYSSLASVVADEELISEELARLKLDVRKGARFMPIDWKFALAVSDLTNPRPRIVCSWTRRQYIHPVVLDDSNDDGYVIGKISSDHPLDPPGLHDTENWIEQEPIAALQELLG
jgi:hypothetical protein